MTNRPARVQPCRMRPGGSAAAPEVAGDPSATLLAGTPRTERCRLPARVITYDAGGPFCSSLPLLVLLISLAIFLLSGRCAGGSPACSPWWSSLA